MKQAIQQTLKRLPWPLRARSESESWSQGIARAAVNLLLLIAVIGVGGLLVVVSGVVPIKASTGHWPITAWMLNFAMERSVATHTLPIDSPPLDQQRLVILGAGHFETGCQPCHGRPGQPIPPIAAAMTPKPPTLSDAVANWEAEELFYIVKHGVKFAGMPAWPTQVRDDEVWAVTAFLQALPGFDAQEYKQLVHGETRRPDLQINAARPVASPPAVVDDCVRCHGAAGTGRGVGAFPKLAGQSAPYLREALIAYRNRARTSGVMAPLAAELSDADIDDLARYYAELEPGVGTSSGDSTEAVALGRQLASEGIPDKNVPACIGCHGPSEKPRNPNYPTLTGQYEDYLVQQLELFRAGVRGGGDYGRLMKDVATQLTDEQIQALAAYYAN